MIANLPPWARSEVERVLDGAARRLLEERLAAKHDRENTTSRAAEPDSPPNSQKAPGRVPV
jgi:hypothetical protein